MFRPTDSDDLRQAYDYIKDRVADFYASSVYSNACNRYDRRKKAYYCQAAAKDPIWASKLYFAIFFLGCKSLDAQFKAAHRQDPFVFVSPEQGSGIDQSVLERAQIAHFDLNHDLYISRFLPTLNKLYWFLEVFGTAVAREYWASDVQQASVRSVIYDQWGVSSQQSRSQYSVVEHTKTDWIHPLNFAHDITRSEFWESRWASARFEVPISEVYKWRKNPNYIRENVEELIRHIEAGEGGSWSATKDTFYCDNLTEGNTCNANTIIVDEYSGDLNYSGNEEDNGLYYALVCRQFNLAVRCDKSPYRRHPYWKMRTYPDPFGPYGVDPCSMLLPINTLKNDLVNQYITWVKANAKFMYEVNDGTIPGGALSLVNGVPGGLVLLRADDYKEFPNGVIRPVAKDKNGIQGIGDLINFMEKYEIQASPQSNYRGQETAGMTDTATGIGLLAQKEDRIIAALQDEADQGIEDGMHLKLENRIDHGTEPVAGVLKEGQPAVSYFPWEMAGAKYAMKIQRITADMQAGKYMSFLKLGLQLQQMGIVDAGGLAKLAKVVGRNLGIDEIDEIVRDAKPEIGPGGQPSTPNAAAAGVPELPAPDQNTNAMPGAGAANAMAMA